MTCRNNHDTTRTTTQTTTYDNPLKTLSIIGKTKHPTMSNNNNNSIDVLLFDLDGTLYDETCGYVEEIHSNIYQFMVQSIGGKFDDITSLEQAQDVWEPIFQKYNQTKQGLISEGYQFDSQEYDTFVRRGAEHYFTQPDKELRTFLQSLDPTCRKMIFTNAPESSAKEVLELLGVGDLFEDHHILGSDFMKNQVCKPDPQAFQMVLHYLNTGGGGQHEDDTNIEPSRVCYFEDSYKNLCAGKQIGFRTVFVKSPTMNQEGITDSDLEQFDAIVETKVGMSLRPQMPYLWKNDNTSS